MWHDMKPSLNHFKNWECLTYVLAKDAKKLNSRIEWCMFAGCPKWSKGGQFYNSKDQSVKVLTYATFHEESYINNFKPRSRLLLQKLSRK